MKKLREMLAIFAAAIVAAFGVFSLPAMTVQAETTSASSVMDDLKTDAAFSEESYPSMTLEEMKAAGQAELEIIKIGESIDDQLYIYVYQPTDATKEIEASYLKIAQTESESSARVCPLKLVSTEGVFDKYLVDEFSVMSTLSQRYYQITSIFRPFDKDLDAETGNDNTNSNIDIPVGQTWHARAAEDGKIEYAYTKDDLITITDEWHGSIRYSDGTYLLGTVNTDSHFVAFTTNYLIEELQKIEIYFKKQEVEYKNCKLCKASVVEKSDVITPVYKKIEGKEEGNKANFLFGHKYNWDTIATIAKFRESEDWEILSEDGKYNLREIEKNANGLGAWIVRFEATSYNRVFLWPGHLCWQTALIPGPDEYLATSTSYGEEIRDVTILKLTFKTKGIPYTLGVVDSMTTSDNNPDGEKTFWDGVNDNLSDLWIDFQRILRIIGLIIGGFALFFILIFIIRLIGWIRSAFGKRNGGSNNSGDGNAGGNAGGGDAGGNTASGG